MKDSLLGLIQLWRDRADELDALADRSERSKVDADAVAVASGLRSHARGLRMCANELQSAAKQ
jgi:hypothetical protein